MPTIELTDSECIALIAGLLRLNGEAAKALHNNRDDAEVARVIGLSIASRERIGAKLEAALGYFAEGHVIFDRETGQLEPLVR